MTDNIRFPTVAEIEEKIDTLSNISLKINDQRRLTNDENVLVQLSKLYQLINTRINLFEHLKQTTNSLHDEKNVRKNEIAKQISKNKDEIQTLKKNNIELKDIIGGKSKTFKKMKKSKNIKSKK